MTRTDVLRVPSVMWPSEKRRVRQKEQHEGNTKSTLFPTKFFPVKHHHRARVGVQAAIKEGLSALFTAI